MSQTAERAFQVVEHVARARAVWPGRGRVGVRPGQDRRPRGCWPTSNGARWCSEIWTASATRSAPRLVSLAAVVIGGSGLPNAAQPHLERFATNAGRRSACTCAPATSGSASPAPRARVLRRVLTIGEPVRSGPVPPARRSWPSSPTDERAEVLALARARLGDDGRPPTRSCSAQGASLAGAPLVAIGDRTPGVGAVSVPVFGPGGVVAAVTAAGPAERWTAARMRAFVPR